MSIREWALRRAKAYMESREPDFEIGPPGDRYLQRWIVGPWGRYDRKDPPKGLWPSFKRKLPNLYLHRFRHDDEDRALHDHPWPSCSWHLENGYWEVLFLPLPKALVESNRRHGLGRPTVKVFRPEGGVTFRRAGTAHRVVLERKAGKLGRAEPVEVITAFFTGFLVRQWGFACPKGWVPWREFVDERDSGAVGKGCGD